MDKERIGSVLIWIGGMMVLGTLLVLLWSWMCEMLNRYDTVVGELMSPKMVNTFSVFGVVGLVFGLLVLVVGVLVLD